MGSKYKLVFAGIISFIVMINGTYCFSETLKILGMSFSSDFPTEDEWNDARSRFEVKSISEIPDDVNFRIESALFRDGRIMVTCSDANYHGYVIREYMFFFDLEGTFITGFYVEHRIRSGSHTALYINGILYYYMGNPNCLFEVNSNSETNYYYVPPEYEFYFVNYKERIGGCDIRVETNDTGNNVIFTDVSGNKSILFSDAYDGQWKEKQDQFGTGIVIFVVTVNIYLFVIRKLIAKRRQKTNSSIQK